MPRISPLLFGLLATTAAASDAPPPDARFALLAPLAGHCYTAPMGDKLSDEQCFEWMYDGAFLRSTHVVSGGEGKPYQGTTMFSWDGREQRLRYHYFTSTGALSVGHVEEVDGISVFVETHVDQAGKSITLRSAFRIDGERGFSVETRVEGAAADAPPKARTYTRK